MKSYIMPILKKFPSTIWFQLSLWLFNREINKDFFRENSKNYSFFTINQAFRGQKC